MAAFLPYQAYLALMRSFAPAIAGVNRRHLLRQTAEMSRLAASAHLDAFRAQLLPISALAAVLVDAIRGFFFGTGVDAPFFCFGLPPRVLHSIIGSALGAKAGTD
jgi:hypothetical protein